MNVHASAVTSHSPPLAPESVTDSFDLRYSHDIVAHSLSSTTSTPLTSLFTFEHPDLAADSMLTGPSLGPSAASPSLHRRRSFTLPSSLRSTRSRSRSGSAPPPSSMFSSSSSTVFRSRPDDAVMDLLGAVGWKLLSWGWLLLRFTIRLLINTAWVAAIAVPTVFLASTYLKIAARLRAVDEHAAFLLLNVIALQQLRTALFGSISKGVSELEAQNSCATVEYELTPDRAARRVIAGALFGVFAKGAWGEASLVYGAGPHVIGIGGHGRGGAVTIKGIVECGGSGAAERRSERGEDCARGFAGVGRGEAVSVE
ncbi:hypothetical protein A1Q2_07634 [Trichosporon asahii var. asahii CBS 8904]|uniref:Uncharacterized protein n=1 Tax=Trichosporon asahii var. asahii (strain CBS 8904) TaxID=1220162 RepID=K1W8Z5_TRIAC|nr:hypothetical protein A1Q2_07634 [Trichosporon asahii var. asahii CBS 8904]